MANDPFEYCASCEVAIVPGCEVERQDKPHCPECAATFAPCDDCGEDTVKTDLTEIQDGDHMCGDCLDSLTTCDHCSEHVASDDCREVRSGRSDELWCERCRDDSATFCHTCENDFDDDSEDGTTCGDYWYCESCASDELCTCYSCSDVLHRESDNVRYSDLANEYYCDDCYYERFTSCDSCGEEMEREEGCHDENGHYCSECVDSDCQCEYHNGGRGIQNYSYRPCMDFHGCNGKPQLYLGFELEVGNKAHSTNNSDAAEELIGTADDFLYCKADCSINGNTGDGFEIVSHPFTWQWLQDNPERLDAIFDLPDKGFRSFHCDDCGMHVHLSISQFSNFHLYKFLRFFYDNPVFMEKVAGRATSWGKLNRDQPDTKTAKEKRTSERYQAVNVAYHTVEVRMFNGNLKRAGFFKNLEFTHAAYGFTMQASPRELTEGNFKAYVKTNRKQYPNLAAFLGVAAERKQKESDAAGTEETAA